MPSEIKTENLGLNKWEGNEYPKRTDFVNDNEIIDEAIGKLESLKTDNKSNIVAAVNEVREQNEDLSSQVGTIETQTLPESYEFSRNISSLSKRGKLDAGLNGMTANQIVENGNFANGTTGWTASGSTLSVSNNTLVVAGDGASNSARAVQNFNFVEEHVYYGVSTVKVTNSVCTQIKIRFANGLGDINVNNPVQNTLYTVSRVFTATSAENVNYVAHFYADAATANGKILEVQNVMCIDLTEIDQATKAALECDTMFPKYFDGLQGASNIEVLSVGKNLFDKNKIQYSQTVNADGTLETNANYNVSDFIKLKPSTTYYIHNQGSTRFAYYDKPNGNVISAELTVNNTFTTPSILVYAIFKIIKGNEDIIQIEEDNGQELGIYEEYKATSNLYKTLDGEVITLHRVPNGVADRIVEQNGQMRLEKNVEEYVLQSGDITALNTAGALDYLIIALPLTWSDGHYSVIMDGATYNNSASSANIQYAYTFVSRITDKKINYYVPKDTYADLAAAQTALAGTKIIYQLAEPQIIDTNVTPLIAEPNGHVFISSDGCLPSNIMSYPINLGAQIDGVIEGQKQLNEYLKDRVIEESGSNENGNYVRFADGTQICLKSEYFEIPIDTATGNLFYNNVNWIFPAAFISAPNYVGNTPMQSGKQIWGGSLAVVPTQTAAILRVFSALSLTTAITEMRFVAIGRWK